MLYKGDICNIMSLIASIMLHTKTLENGRFNPTLAYSFVLLLQKPRLLENPEISCFLLGNGFSYLYNMLTSIVV